MAQTGLTPIRRVVTGNDAQGKSKVVWDGPAPGTHEVSMGAGRGHTDFWVWNESPPPLSGTTDDGNLPYDFPGPPKGGHWRVVQGAGRAPDYDPAKDPHRVPGHEPKEHPLGRRWDRGGTNAYSGGMHKTETVDYAILLDGERTLVLDDGEVTWLPGDIVIDVGAWHLWDSSKMGCLMAFDMFDAEFVDGPAGTAQGNDPVLRPRPDQKLPPGVKPQRRIVIIDRVAGKSSLVGENRLRDAASAAHARATCQGFSTERRDFAAGRRLER
jgi:hypothetical protein